ncbi:hypothetical protein Daura_17640 [Dactylosporangium aurantiacum]|uniref:Uncharacterized protein n=1 Tax=Dactylosporangium aurantiacum TaxID=35754 RepID=A0A9Q9IKH0_9ACTN|nr:hypothetical protein [Dactylosporangium aurantiacum]MDG6109843.1 hypothetical protein [Dactylosporangium aurantiacum]UWZ57827.1 hypothetical protein Daura_17640 [Dactylosporangium aurantiacum]
MSERQYPAGGSALVLSAVAAAVCYPLATYGPGWWRGARLPDMDPPFDLGWLHDGLAWTAQYVGPVLCSVFAALAVALLVVAAFTGGFRTRSATVGRLVAAGRAGPGAALALVAALAVGWFLLTQVAALVAPLLGMYHGEIHPAVP